MIDLIQLRAARILIVDDIATNVRLLTHMLTNDGYTAVTSTLDPFEVCALHRKQPYDLILLDLQMPGMSGFEVMAGLQDIEPAGYLPVLVITAQPDHKLRALKAGAKDFVSKPFEIAEVLARVRNVLEVRLLYQKLGAHNVELQARVTERTRDLHDSYLEAIFTMMRAAEHKDEDTGAHVQRISYYSRALAEKLGMDSVFIDQIFFASPMHDIGKIGIPDSILLKPGCFTAPEWGVMKGHASQGAAILGMGKSPYLQMGAEIALNHHERFDGGGYPSGKVGTAIPLSARIMNICDIYDALRSKRPYKPAFEHDKSVDIIMHGDGRTEPHHFDPAVLAAFADMQGMFSDIFETHANEPSSSV
jgi:putative two-component system response regulator